MPHRGERLLLAVIAATAVMALAAAPASAVNVVDEATGQPCGAVSVSDHAVSGGCVLVGHTDQEAELALPFGLMYLCEWSVEVRLDGNGEGYVYDQQLSGADCGTQALSEPDGHKQPWPVELTSASTMEMTLGVTFPGGGTSWCHLATIDLTAYDHSSGLIETPGDTHAQCENTVLAQWDLTLSYVGNVEIS